MNYSGAIDYYIFKDYSNHIEKYIIILLDNHNPSEYCKISSKNIDELFESFIDKNSLFILEEPYGLNSSKIISLYPDIYHLTKYLNFYAKYNTNNDKIIPIDIRLLFDNFHHLDYNSKFDMLDQLFGFIKCSNDQIKQIYDIIIKASLLNNIFKNHLEKLRQLYQYIKYNKSTDKCNEIYLSEIFLHYPFKSNIESYCDQIERFLSGLLELYGIAHIITTSKKYIFVYLGAAHCISIASLLEKYYGLTKVKSLDKYSISTIDERFNLGNLNSDTTSCFNFNLDI
jgi:hypothetical protein